MADIIYDKAHDLGILESMNSLGRHKLALSKAFTKLLKLWEKARHSTEFPDDWWNRSDERLRSHCKESASHLDSGFYEMTVDTHFADLDRIVSCIPDAHEGNASRVARMRKMIKHMRKEACSYYCTIRMLRRVHVTLVPTYSGKCDLGTMGLLNSVGYHRKMLRKAFAELLWALQSLGFGFFQPRESKMFDQYSATIHELIESIAFAVLRESPEGVATSIARLAATLQSVRKYKFGGSFQRQLARVKQMEAALRSIKRHAGKITDTVALLVDSGVHFYLAE